MEEPPTYPSDRIAKARRKMPGTPSLFDARSQALPISRGAPDPGTQAVLSLRPQLRGCWSPLDQTGLQRENLNRRIRCGAVHCMRICTA